MTYAPRIAESAICVHTLPQHVEFSPANVTGTACLDTTGGPSTARCTQSGTLDWTDIVSINIYLTNDNGYAVKMYFDQFEYFDSPPVGFYIVRIDHEDDGIYEDGRAVFQANGITPQLVGNNEGSATATSLSSNQIKALKALGWEWADHGARSGDHTILYYLTADQIEADFVASRRDHIASGDVTGGRFYDIPFGGNNNYPYIARDLVKKYYSRGMGYIEDGVGVWNQKDPWWTNGVTEWTTGASTANALAFQKKIIDDISTYGAQASLLMHIIHPTTDTGGQISVASLTTLMEYLSAKITSTANTSNMIINATYSEIEDLWNSDTPRQASHPDVISRNAMLNQAYYAHLDSIKTIIESDTNFTAGDIKFLTTPITTTGTERDYSGQGNDLTHTGTSVISYEYEIKNAKMIDSIYQPMTKSLSSSVYLGRADDVDFEIGNADGTADSDFGICVWVEVAVTAGGQDLASKSDSGGGNQGWEWYLTGSENMTFQIFDADGSNSLVKSNDTVLSYEHSTVGTTISNNIHHLCVTYDAPAGTPTDTENIRLYVDGVIDSSGNDSETGTYAFSHADGGTFSYGYNTRQGWINQGSESTIVVVKGLVMSADTIAKLYDAGRYYYKPYE